MAKSQLLKLEFVFKKNICQKKILEMKNTIDEIKKIQTLGIIEKRENREILKQKSKNFVNDNNILKNYFNGSQEIFMKTSKQNNLYGKGENESKISSFEDILNDQIRRKLFLAERTIDLFLRKFSCLKDIQKHLKNKNWNGKYGNKSFYYYSAFIIILWTICPFLACSVLFCFVL